MQGELTYYLKELVEMESADTQKILAALIRIEQRLDEIARHVKALEADAHKIKDEVKSQYPTT